MVKKVEEIIEESLRLGFPGGQLLVEKSGEIIKRINFGALYQPEKLVPVIGPESYQDFTGKIPPAVTSLSLFDIASLTKIFSITYLFMALYEEDEGVLEQTVSDFYPQYRHHIKGQITLRQLLSHHAGFEPNPLFYDPNYSEELYCQERSEFEISLLKAPLISAPGSRGLYSDVDFMLLTFIAEKITGKRLDHALREYFWGPLMLSSITYNPLDNGFKRHHIAATELNGNTRDHSVDFPNIRQETIWGEVQDEKAFHCMGGISGHAGLFSNVETLLKLFRLTYMPNDYFSPETLAHFISPSFKERTFGLGWRLNGPDMRYMFGDFASMRAYGHTGWTGTLAIHDPEYELTILYLTNRKHSAVVDGMKNPHLFEADRLPAGRYLNIIHSIYYQLGLT